MFLMHCGLVLLLKITNANRFCCFFISYNGWGPLLISQNTTTLSLIYICLLLLVSIQWKPYHGFEIQKAPWAFLFKWKGFESFTLDWRHEQALRDAGNLKVQNILYGKSFRCYTPKVSRVVIIYTKWKGSFRCNGSLLVPMYHDSNSNPPLWDIINNKIYKVYYNLYTQK